jgi:tetratricopeptide (TPR) repeat protein
MSVVYEPIRVPGRVWVEHVEVLRARDAAGVLRLARRYTGASQHRLAGATEMTPGRVNGLFRGTGGPVISIDVWERIAEGLNLPDQARLALGLAPTGSRSRPDTPGQGPVVDVPWRDEEGDPMDRRQALHSLGAGVGATASLASPQDRRALLGALAAITVGAPPPDLSQWLPAPGLVQVSGKVTAEMVETVTAVTAAHRQLDFAGGGGACLGSAHGYLAWAATLLSNDCVSPAVAAGLRSAVAELHSLVGWAAHDLGRHDLARRHLTGALTMARQVDDLPLMAYTLFQLGRVSQHQDEPAEALHLFALGRHAAEQAGCRATSAMLHANTAWAYAQLGQPDQVDKHLTRYRRGLDQAAPEGAPTWTRHALSEADHCGRSGLVHTALARHDEHRRHANLAVEEASAALALGELEGVRAQIFVVISLAEASLLTGEFTEATNHGTQAVTLAEAGMQSVRVVDRLASMWELATPHLDTHPDLAALGARVHAMQPTA